MQMSSVFGVSAILCSLSFVTAFAGEHNFQKPGFYAKFSGGISWGANKLSRSDYDKKKPLHPTHISGVGIGYVVNENFRTDFTFTNRGSYKIDYVDDTNERITQKLRNQTAMLNFYYDFLPQYKVKPFVVLGAGYANNIAGTYVSAGNGDSTVVAGKDHHDFAWKVGGGVRSFFADNIALGMEYNYVNLGKFGTSSRALDGDIPEYAAETHFRAHEVIFNISYKF